MLLGPYPFAGPFARWEELQHRAGLFAILACPPASVQAYHPLFVGEADDIYQQMATLSAKFMYPVGPEQGVFAFAALYTDLLPSARRHLVAELRTLYQLPPSIAGVMSVPRLRSAAARPALPRDRRYRRNE